jgi:peptide deformylase
VEYDDARYMLANPEITRRSEETAVAEEGCLSLPNLFGDVERATSVRVQGLDLTNKRVTVEAEGWLARIFQHEIDHLDGILFPDRMAPGAQLRQLRAAPVGEEI